MKTQNKIFDIVEKILEFNNQQKGTGLKILTPKQMLQILPIALAQVKAGNNSERLLFILFINQNKLLKKYIIT